MDYQNRIMEEIKANAGRIHSGGSVGIVYPLGDGLAAKVLRDSDNAQGNSRDEFLNLTRIKDLRDPRLQVPTPIGIVSLVTGNELKSIDSVYFRSDEIGQAVVMEYIKGRSLGQWDTRDKARYRHTVDQMLDALLERHVYKHDLKAEEIIGREE